MDVRMAMSVGRSTTLVEIEILACLVRRSRIPDITLLIRWVFPQRHCELKN